MKTGTAPEICDALMNSFIGNFWHSYYNSLWPKSSLYVSSNAMVSSHSTSTWEEKKNSSTEVSPEFLQDPAPRYTTSTPGYDATTYIYWISPWTFTASGILRLISFRGWTCYPVIIISIMVYCIHSLKHPQVYFSTGWICPLRMIKSVMVYCTIIFTWYD